jgi:uncharacterized membrane protein YgdD (TMEM256/DUF423 family)
MIKNNNLAITGAALLLLSIALGAMGAHAFEKILSPDRLKSFLTGNQYLTIHGLAFLILALFPKSVWKPARIIFIGLMLFSGSIFLLIVVGHLGYSIPKALALTTPIGGSLMIVGWTILLVQFIRYKNEGVNE